jgi:hypothetical protein
MQTYLFIAVVKISRGARILVGKAEPSIVTPLVSTIESDSIQVMEESPGGS